MELRPQTAPQVIEFEKMVLGTILLFPKSLIEVIGFLHSETFFSEQNQEIYSCIFELYQSGKPVTVMTVVNTLRAKGKLEFCGGPIAIAELTNPVTSSVGIEYHARIIQEKYILRGISVIGQSLYNNAFNPATDPLELLQESQSELLKIVSQNITGEAKSVASISRKTYDKIVEISQKEDLLLGVPSGLVDLDRITSGFNETDLIILAARPGMGKTTMALTAAYNAACMGFQTDIYSLEMSGDQLVKKLYAIAGQLNDYHIRTGKLDEQGWEMLNEAVGKVERLPLHIDDTAGLNYTQLRSKCLRAKAERNTKLIILDYLQLMSGDNKKSRNDQISDISRNLKLIAKETQTPVIALSQLSRQVEQRGGAKRPILSDLRDSGAVEQDADQVMFIYRPEYYGINEDEEGRSTQGIAEIILAKNRHGETTTVTVRADLAHSTFRDLSYSNTPF